MSSDNVFHTHLDHCRQCREEPFNLCPEGGDKLREAVESGSANSFDRDLDRHRNG